MVRSLIYGLLIAFLLLVSTTEIGYAINKSYTAALLSAGAATALLFSLVWSLTTGDGMPPRDEESGSGVMKFKGFGSEVTLPAKASNAVTLVFLCGLAAFGWKHHTDTVEWSQKIYDATLKNTKAMTAMTYVLTLSQEKREKLNLEMPEEVRQMQRHNP